MIQKDLMHYGNYYGSIHFDAEEETFYGKVEFIRDLITYEASNAKTLIKNFREAIDEYNEDCKSLGKSPDISFKGSFNVRIDSDLHKEASLHAMRVGDTLNGLVKKALSQFLECQV